MATPSAEVTGLGIEISSPLPTLPHPNAVELKPSPTTIPSINPDSSSRPGVQTLTILALENRRFADRVKVKPAIAEPVKVHTRWERAQSQVAEFELPPLIEAVSPKTRQVHPASPIQSDHFPSQNQDNDSLTHNAPPRHRLTKAKSILSRRDKDDTLADQKASKIAKWFDGHSEPVRIGVLPSPRKEVDNPFENLSVSDASEHRPLRSRKSLRNLRHRPAMTSLVSLLTGRSSPTKTNYSDGDVDDDLLNLDITTLLGSACEPVDEESPSDVKMVQKQAEALCTRFQKSLQQRTRAWHEAVAEHETISEESQAAQMRTKHLQLQLDAFSAKVEAQESAIRLMSEDLACEKAKRQSTEELMRKSVRLVRPDGEHFLHPDHGHSRSSSRHSIMSTSSTSLDTDADDDSASSGAPSVFDHSPTRHGRGRGRRYRAHSHSGSISASSVSTADPRSSAEYATAKVQHYTSVSPPAKLQIPAFTVDMFQNQSEIQGNAQNQPEAQSQRIQGREQDQPEAQTQTKVVKDSREAMRADEAWEVVGILKEENAVLKTRVGDLESAVEGALEAVTILGLPA